jgi:hypothetical protein
MIKDPTQIAIQTETIRRATPLWKGMVEAYSTVLYHAGASSNAKVAVVGKSGWVFLGDAYDMSFSQSIRRRVLTDEQVTRWTETLRFQVDWLARRGIRLFYIVAPSLSSIYPEYLPDWTRALLDQPTSFDKILAAGHDLPIIDLRSTLVSGRNTADTYSKLNTHWNEFGAWGAWQHIAPQLAAALPGLQPFGVGDLNWIERFAVCENEYKYLIGIMGCDTQSRPHLKQQWPEFQITSGPGARPTKYAGDTIIYDSASRETLNSTVSNRLKLLFLRDSMGMAIAPYFHASFYETVQLHYGLVNNSLPTLIERHKPDVLLYVVTERLIDHIGDHYFWSSLNEFDAAPRGGDLTWKASGKEGLEVDGDKGLARPLVISWGTEPRSAKAGAFRIIINAQGFGVMRLDYRLNGQTERREQAFVPGANELYFYVPSGIDGARVTTVADGPVASAVMLESITLRLLLRM